jgi:hypothetical protein
MFSLCSPRSRLGLERPGLISNRLINASVTELASVSWSRRDGPRAHLCQELLGIRLYRGVPACVPLVGLCVRGISERFGCTRRCCGPRTLPGCSCL